MKIDKSLMSGSTTLLILSLLAREELYGYQMITELADQVFAFPYEPGRWISEEEEADYKDLNLGEIVDLWYRKADPHPGVYTLLNEEFPCTVTLYGEAGEVLETFELTVATEEIRSWW